MKIRLITGCCLMAAAAFGPPAVQAQPMAAGGVPAQVYGYQMMPYYSARGIPYPYVVSAAVDILPAGFTTIVLGGVTYYYHNGVFYQKVMREDKYIVVAPPVGAVVFQIPDGYQLLKMEGVLYYVYDGVFYRRVLEGYEVAYPPV